MAVTLHSHTGPRSRPPLLPGGIDKSSARRRHGRQSREIVVSREYGGDMTQFMHSLEKLLALDAS